MFLDSDYNASGFSIKSFSDENFLNADGDNTPLTEAQISFGQQYGAPMLDPEQAGGPGGMSSVFGGSLSTMVMNQVIAAGCRPNQPDANINTWARNNNSYDWNFCTMFNNIQPATISTSVNSQVPYSTNMSCDEYVNVQNQLQELSAYWSNASVVNEYDRDLRTAYMSTISNSMTEVGTYMQARDCQGATSAIDVAQQAQAATQTDLLNVQTTLQEVEAQALIDSRAAEVSARAEKRKLESEQEEELEQLAEDAATELEAQRLENEKAQKQNKMLMFGAVAVIVLVVLYKK